MLRVFQADLHVHTCLSPCAELTMGPRTIVAAARERGLDLIGITDHNSSENAPAVTGAARGSGLTVLPGLEVTSREEVHVLALFDELEAAFRLQEAVYAHLPGQNDGQRFGLQVIVSEEHDVLGFNSRLLAGAAEFTVEELVELIHELGGLAIAAHIDREAFGILGQLGFLPAGLEFDALELSPQMSRQEAARRLPEWAAGALVRFSDAHRPEEIGRAFTPLVLREPTTAEIRKAFRGEGERQVLWSESAGARQRGCDWT